MFTTGDSRENDPMTKVDEGGEHRRHDFSKHHLNGGSGSFSIFDLGLYTFMHTGHAVVISPCMTQEPKFFWEMPAMSGLVFAVLRPAKKRACADIHRMKRVWCAYLE